MANTTGLVLGFNSPRVFACDDRRAYVPAANGVVVSSDGESILWQPTDCLYEIDQIALSSRGVLCLTEKRLSVSLLFFHATDFRKVHEVPAIGHVEVEDITFSKEGNALFVLLSIPTTCVKVLHATSNDTFTMTHTLDLLDVHYSCVMSARFSNRADDFVILNEDNVRGFSLTDSGYSECFAVNCSDQEYVTCASAMEAGVLYGTSKGKVYLHDFARGTQVLVAALESPVTALCGAKGDAYVCTEDAKVRHVHMNCFANEVSFELTAAGVRIEFLDDETTLIIGTGSGIIKYMNIEDGGLLFPVKEELPGVVGCHAGAGDAMVVVLKDGDYIVGTDESVCYWQCTTNSAAVASCLFENFLITACADGTVRAYDAIGGRLFGSVSIPDLTPICCTANTHGTILVHNEKSLHFFVCEESQLSPCGYVKVDPFEAQISPVSFARGLPNEDVFMVICQNGDAFLIKPPSCSPSNEEHTVESVIVGMWRLDCPIVDLYPCYVENDVINILVHSLDKETKLYALDRRRDKEVRAVRPLFLMKDHKSGGGCFSCFDSTTVCSAGKDGRIILRDISPYQAKLSTIPPSKEKRKPIYDVTAWQFAGGGVSSVCVSNGMIVCAGSGPVVKVIPSGNQAALGWKEPKWTVRRIWTGKDESSESNLHGSSNMGATAMLQEVREELVDRLCALQREWNTLTSQTDVQVPVETLLLPDQRSVFEVECQDAVFKMKEDKYYDMLENEHTQELIKERCCKSMEVPRAKVVSLQQLGLEAHNFHIVKQARVHQAAARKVVFLRKLQSRVKMGSYFSDLRKVNNPPLKESATAQEELTRALHSPYDVYTHGRVVCQSLLLKGLILALKDAFNERFEDARRKKHHAITMIEERTTRCVKIIKQLGEIPVELFSIVVDKEEDPNTLFTVEDEELDEGVRRLIPPKAEVSIVSPVNEAALKLWMDGLEKEVELIRVRITPPEFADESRDTYVAPEDRTEEQVKLIEDYEKKLAEETESVNTRREALRHEFKTLQKQNCQNANDMDEELKRLRQLRVETSEKVDAAELQLVLLLRHNLLPYDRHKWYMELEKQVVASDKQKQHIETSISMKRVMTTHALSLLDALEEQLNAFVSDVKAEFPFNDTENGEKLHRRFARWKKRTDEAKGEVPLGECPEDIPEELWMGLSDHCGQVNSLRARLVEAEQIRKEEVEALQVLEDERDKWSAAAAECEKGKAELKDKLLHELLNTESLYHVHQGQIQNEKATMSSEFSTSCLRWVDDVDQYNQQILLSAAESAKLCERIVNRHRNMKVSRWETERLQYCIGTLQLELRQLHTLRVSRLMQEWLSGDADLSEEQVIAKIDEHIAFVNASMDKKVQAITKACLRLKSQASERISENALVEKECEQLRSKVQDQLSVKALVDLHADGSLQISQRAKEIYETSELEEQARSQQEDLLRLKKEVDRLRERTFPSFAVVSKRTI